MDWAASTATIASSAVLRLVSFIFLRWIPGPPMVPLVTAALAIYLPAFIYLALRSSPYVVTSDEVAVVTTSDFDHNAALKDADPALVDTTVDDVGEEITVEETIVLEKQDPAVLQSLLTGLPSPSSLLTTVATLLLNIALVAMVLDYTYRARYLHQAQDLSFARLGYVSDTTATILVREPKANALPVVARIRSVATAPTLVRSPWRETGSIKSLDNSTDYTGRIVFTGLRSETSYEYALSNNFTGYFDTAPRNGHVPRQGTFDFLHSSCLKNNFPYSPLRHPLANAGLRYLQVVLTQIEAQFMLFLGDFIYIDVPKRHGESNVEDYRREYRQIYASPDWPSSRNVPQRQLPWIHVYDDHEISNDWDKNTTGYFSAAVDPYEHYHIAANPPAARRGETYFQFTNGPASFFMLDTRRYRSPNDKTNGSDPITGAATKTMLGQRQLSDLLAWLKQPEPAGVRWKILVSSVPFTKNWWYGAQDTWRGYLGERQIILEAMWDVGAKGGVGVVVLSGDRHEFAATAFPPPPGGKIVEQCNILAKAAAQAQSILAPGSGSARKHWPASAVVHEFSASPLNMFYLPIRTYAESSTSTDYTSDVCIKYLPDGNSKVGAVSISSPDTSDQSILHYRLFIDGKEKWSYTITTPPYGSNEIRNNPIWG